MSGFFAEPDVVLEDERVLLRPIVAADADALAEIAFDPAIWRFFVSSIQSRDELRQFVNEAVDTSRAGAAVAFTVVDKASGSVAGSTRFGNLSARDQRVEVGWTWLGRRFQGTGTNARCKLLLMEYAFECQSVQRTEFKTDVLNKAARRALLKVGCTEEGVLRSHTLMPGGRRRDTIYYSVLAGEWPGVKTHLRNLILSLGGAEHVDTTS